MAQFDISVNENKASKTEVPYLMVIQSDSVSILGSRIVVPLRKTADVKNRSISKIHVPIEIADEEYIAFISEMAAIPAEILGSVISNGTSKRTEITAAIDLLFTGF